MSIRFVTDSCSDIPWDYAKENKIKVVPLSVHYNNKVFKETLDFDLEKHYNNYKINPNFLPKTSQPTPGEYFKVYEELIKEGASTIVVICISSKLSGTINSAQAAAKKIKENHPEINFYFIDSLNASYSEVFLIEEGLDLVKKGMKIEKVIEKLELLKTKIKTFIFIPTLKFLHLNGRISLTKYLLGKLLRKKVIIRVNEEGANETVCTVNTPDQAIAKLVEIATQKGTIKPRKVCIVHAFNPQLAKKLELIVKKEIPNIEYKIIQTKVTISAHTGPDAVALVSDFGTD